MKENYGRVLEPLMLSDRAGLPGAGLASVTAPLLIEPAIGEGATA